MSSTSMVWSNRTAAPGTNGSMGRELPHSVEAESGLLGCCLLDDGITLQRCLDSGINPSFFYILRNEALFRTLVDLNKRKVVIDTAIVAEELKSVPEFGGINVYLALVSITEVAPTTAQASYFIEKVTELAHIRKLIRSATSAVEQCYEFTSDFPALITSLDERLRPLLSTESFRQGSVISAWVERRAGFGRALKSEEPTMFMGKIPVLNRGNIGLVTALRKTGKTAVCGGMLGAIIAGEHPHGDTLGFFSSNPSEHAVIHFDTEQSPKDHEALSSTILRRAGVDRIPPWFYSYGVKGVSVEEQRRRLRQLLRETERLHKGIHTVALDGIADLVQDPNDPKECNPFVTELEAISSDYNCSVTCLLHLNPPKRSEPTKGRGHLGSQLERKCETELRINTDAEGIGTVYTECARHVPIREKDGTRFKWDHDAAMHLTCASAVNAKDAAKRDKAIETLDAVFHHANSDALRFAEFLKAISAVAGVKASAAEDRFYQIKNFGLIEKNLLGFWSKRTPSA